MMLEPIRAGAVRMLGALRRLNAERAPDPAVERMRRSLQDLEDALDVLRWEVARGRAAPGDRHASHAGCAPCCD